VSDTIKADIAKDVSANIAKDIRGGLGL